MFSSRLARYMVASAIGMVGTVRFTSSLSPHHAAFFSSLSSNLQTKYSGGCSTDENINESPEAHYASSKDLRLDLSHLLSDSEILSSINSLKEEKRIIINQNFIQQVHINSYKANYSIEDSHSSYPHLGLFGVYDGHSGSAASNFCRTSLLEYCLHYRLRGWSKQLLSNTPFLHADNHFLHAALSNPKHFSYGLSGSCYNVLSVFNGKVTSAAGGDVRAIIGRKDSSAPTGYSLIELSRDHQIDTHYHERERLLSEHPDELDIIRHNRVKGRLQPTRGMGDGAYKDNRFYEEKKKGMKHPSNQWNPPYTTAEPEIHTHCLTPDDSFLVLATDGLFQELTSQQVVDMMGKFMETKKEGDNAATYLIRQALVAASEQAIGRRSTQNANLSWILRLPAGARRNVHDDITVTVLFFDPNAKGWEDEQEFLKVVQTANIPVPALLDQAVELQKQQQIQSKL
jgi:pyruvate dehydrogenase phosphatase